MLRHVFGLLAGLLCAPLLWAGAAWSAAEVGTLLGGGGLDSGLVMPAIAVLMAIGVLGGVLAGSRTSPLAAFLSGGLLLGVCLWPLLDPASLDAALPAWLGSGSMFHPLGPALPIVLPLSTLLFISALMPSRWRPASAPYGVPPEDEGHGRPPYPPGPAPEAGEPSGDGGPAKTTTPFQRDPSGGAPRPAWGDASADPASRPRTFRDGEER